MQFCISVALFTGLGIWLDRTLGTVVVFTLIGLALGFGGGTYSIYKDIYGKRRRQGNAPQEQSPQETPPERGATSDEP